MAPPVLGRGGLGVSPGQAVRTRGFLPPRLPGHCSQSCFFCGCPPTTTTTPIPHLGAAGKAPGDSLPLLFSWPGMWADGTVL